MAEPFISILERSDDAGRFAQGGIYVPRMSLNDDLRVGDKVCGMKQPGPSTRDGRPRWRAVTCHKLTIGFGCEEPFDEEVLDKHDAEAEEGRQAELYAALVGEVASVDDELTG